jgi:hypothetical protein
MTQAVQDQSRSTQAFTASRLVLFFYALLVACPIRYWPVKVGIADDTWIFALNYAAAHGLSIGSDVVWTTGPLGYLVLPQDMGGNLAKGLVFQVAIWALLTWVFVQLFFRSELSLRNLTAFSIFFGLAAPLFWFNHMGIENLLIAGVLILLVLVRRRPNMPRYLAALVVIGIIPLIKLTGGVIAAGALGGFLLEEVIRTRSRAWRSVLLGILVPIATAALGCWLTLPSIAAFRDYVTASREIAGGFSVAMSRYGRPIEYLMGVEVLILLAALFGLLVAGQRKIAGFFPLLLAVPVMTSLKHGFVRQDDHLLNFICFASLAMALIAVLADWTTRRRLLLGVMILLPFLVLWQDYVIHFTQFEPGLGEVTGTRAPRLAVNALLRYGSVRRRLRSDAEAELSSTGSRLEPEIRTIVGGSPVASLSLRYSGAFVEGLNLQLYPVIQRYSAYTPYLDGWNAAWIREKGPRFLLFDGETIDSRDGWAETPAMWLEVYRWYDTRLAGSRNLLLERREQPRFQRLESIGRMTATPAEGLHIPSSSTPLFWTMSCHLNTKGRLQKLLFRVPGVDMVEKTCSGAREPRRVLIDVLSSPVMGNFLPDKLADFAALFSGATPACAVNALAFEAGIGSYSDRCEVEFLRPAQ